MNLLESLQVAVDSLIANKMRSFLTMLGIIIGVTAVLVVVAIGQGLKTEVISRIERLGTNLLVIIPGYGRGRGPTTRPGRLTDDDFTALRGKVPYVKAMAPTLRSSAQVKYHNLKHSTQVIGTTTDWVITDNATLTHGRFFTKSEERARANVVVLGAAVVEELFYGRPLVGEQIRINNIPFRVIGLLKEKGGGFGNPDDQVVIPLSTARYRLFGSRYLTTINVSTISPDKAEVVTESIKRVLRRQHRLGSGEDDFRIMSQTELLSTIGEQTAIITLFLGAIAAVSLLVGGVGIMNIMLVSVAERTREIGIRKAVGAKRRDILAQFLIESAVLSAVGGIIGIFLGVAIAAIGPRLGYQTSVPLQTIIIAFVFAAAVGIFFGYYPARRAALLDPIECLRYE